MASNKIQRINDDIRLALSELLRNIKDPRVNQGMITVTAVETTGDLKYATVYLSVFGLENEKDFNRGLKSASGWLRRELGHKVQLRNVPELIFKLDHSIEYGAHINEIIRTLDIPEDDAAEADDDDLN